jgi:Xaa-Pro dipeptidase
MVQSEEKLVAGLLDAQRKAQALFAEIEARNLIRPGVTETQINESIYALAASMWGIAKYWHKRIVRAGRNTLAPYDENPPDLTVAEDDIAFLDLGPVFEQWEADFGRTYVVGNDPVKHRLRRDIEEGFAKGKQYFKQHPDITIGEGSRLGVRGPHRRTSDRGISPRENSGRQDHVLRPSRKPQPDADAGCLRPGPALDPRNAFCGS